MLQDLKVKERYLGEMYMLHSHRAITKPLWPLPPLACKALCFASSPSANCFWMVLQCSLNSEGLLRLCLVFLLEQMHSNFQNMCNFGFHLGWHMGGTCATSVVWRSKVRNDRDYHLDQSSYLWLLIGIFLFRYKPKDFFSLVILGHLQE